MTRRRGVSKWLNRLKGFGFIEPDSDTADVFIHYADLDEYDNYRDLFKGDQGQKRSISHAFKGFESH